MFENQFFVPPGQGEGEPRSKGRVYAAIEVPELDEGFQPYEAEPIYLECIDTSWFNSFASSENDLLWNEFFQVAPLSVLELTSYKLPLFPEGSKPGDIAWFEFGHEPASSSETDARIYTNLFSDGAAVKISFHESCPIEWAEGGVIRAAAQTLAQDNFDKIPKYDLKNRLEEISTAGGVAFYDVGQGACQAAVDDVLHIPQLYVDFGGGAYEQKDIPRWFFRFLLHPRTHDHSVSLGLGSLVFSSKMA